MIKTVCMLCAAIAMSLCCAACAGGAETAPSASSSPSQGEQETIALSVYLPAQYADPTTHYPIYEKLMDYQQAHPNIELTFVSPATNDLTEREALIQ